MCQSCYEQFIENSFNDGGERNSAVEINRIDCGFKCEANFVFRWGAVNEKVCSEIIYRIKKSRSRGAVKFYSKILYSKLLLDNHFEDVDVIVPVPGSSEDSSHAESIATEIGLSANIPVEKWIVRKVGARHDVRQKNLKVQDRKNRNLYTLCEAFEKISRPAGDKVGRVLLIDDVITTGETINECSRLLQPYFSVKAAALFYREKK